MDSQDLHTVHNEQCDRCEQNATSFSSRHSRINDAALVSETRDVLSTHLERFIGKRSANRLSKLGISTVADLLHHVPFRLAHRGELMPIEAVREGDAVTVVARVLSSSLRPMHARRGYILTLIVTDGEHDLELTFFAKNSRPLKFHEMQLQPGTIATFSGTISSYRGRLQLTHPDYAHADEMNGIDAEAIARPIPIYHASASAPSWKIQQAVEMILPMLGESSVPDPLPEDFRRTYALPTKFQALRYLHEPGDEEQWQLAKKRMAYEEAFVLQTILARRRREAQNDSAPRCVPGRISAMFESQLPFALTAGQRAVGETIARDLAQTQPMRRLLQGDVGTGKTVVALRAMLQVLDSGYQAVLLAPTEVLARQHAQTFEHMLGDLAHGGEIGAPEEAIRIELLTGSLTAAQQRSVMARLASGAPSIIVGTHALLYERVQLPHLGFVVIDEQHRFGVDQRDTLARGAHLLVMTATPIPRTIAMTSFGDLDISTLEELPRGRAPISTVLVPADNDVWVHRIWERAREEIERAGRVYVVCPRISGADQHKSDTDSCADEYAGSDDEALPIVHRGLGSGGASVSGGALNNVYSDGDGSSSDRQLAAVEDVVTQLEAEPALEGIGIGYVHGKLDCAAKDAAMKSFASGDCPILVSTTVIEVGIDVPAATMMVILDADRFGLSQLHQLRGRIGRGNQASVCLAVHRAAEGTLAWERLSAFAHTTNGFELAEKDLELRSEGDVLGTDQSGTHSSLTYLSVLHDADIIESAKSAAYACVSADPSLDLPEHSTLKEAVQSIEQTTRAEYIDRS